MLRQEAKKGIPIQTPALTSLSFAVRWEKRIARAIMKPMFESGSNMIGYNNLEESQTKLDELLDQNSLLVIVFNHISHSDIIVGIKLAKEIGFRFSDRINNFYIPIAKSLVESKQGHIAQLFYSEGTLPLLTQQNIEPLPLVTENDQKKRLMKPSFNDTKRLHNAAWEKKSAFLDLAEGSIEGGRYDISGNPKGTQKVTNSFLPYIFQKAHEAGKKVIVLPVGISGTNSMISAESLFLTWSSAGALLENWVFKRSPRLATVTVGRPYEYSPNSSGIPLTRNSQQVNDGVMKNLVQLIPPAERGYYGWGTREYQEDMKTYEELRPLLNSPLALTCLAIGEMLTYARRKFLQAHPAQPRAS